MFVMCMVYCVAGRVPSGVGCRVIRLPDGKRYCSRGGNIMPISCLATVSRGVVTSGELRGGSGTVSELLRDGVLSGSFVMRSLYINSEGTVVL